MAYLCPKCGQPVYDHETICPSCNNGLTFKFDVHTAEITYIREYKKGINPIWLTTGIVILLLGVLVALLGGKQGFDISVFFVILGGAAILIGIKVGRYVSVPYAQCPYCGRLIEPLSKSFSCEHCHRPILRTGNTLKNVEPIKMPCAPLPNISLEDMKKQFFDRWSLLWQCKPEQQERLERAKTEEVYFRLRRLNSDNGTALCYSSKFDTNGLIYEVSFLSCTCQDFSKRSCPCKHIYALTLEIGIMPENEDLSGIPYEIRHRIECLPAESLNSFKKMLREHNDFNPFYIKLTPRIKPLIACDLLQNVGELSEILDMSYSRNDLVAQIYENGINYTVETSTKKSEIISYLVKNEPSFVKKLVKSNSIVRFGDELAGILPFIKNFYCR